MDQHADFITIATLDLDAARGSYVTGLGWTPLLDVPGEILFFQIGHGLTLGLFDAAGFAADLGPGDGAGDGAGELPRVSGLTLSTNVESAATVDAAYEGAISAGGMSIKQPQEAAFGGYHAHVADPSGLIWEIAYNPGWSVDADGTVRLQAVE